MVEPYWYVTQLQCTVILKSITKYFQGAAGTDVSSIAHVNTRIVHLTLKDLKETLPTHGINSMILARLHFHTILQFRGNTLVSPHTSNGTSAMGHPWYICKTKKLCCVKFTIVIVENQYNNIKNMRCCKHTGRKIQMVYLFYLHPLNFYIMPW